MSTHDRAVIFDVDGPLLHLTVVEEDAFFTPLEKLHGLSGLSRDWDSYRVRNDREILHEILQDHLGDRFQPNHYQIVVETYEAVLREGFRSGSLQVSPVSGALELLQQLSEVEGLALGMATANLRIAARIRLEHAGMWQHLSKFPGAADEGGHKRAVLARVVEELKLPPAQIVYIGDNLNDLDAGMQNRTHFIGFHVDAERRARLSANGATHVAGDHRQTLALIRNFLNIPV